MKIKQSHTLVLLTWLSTCFATLTITLGLMLNEAQDGLDKNIRTMLTNEAKLVGYYWLEKITPSHPIPDALPLPTNQTIGCLFDKSSRRVVCNDQQTDPQRLKLLVAHLSETNGTNSMTRQGDYYIVSRGLAFDTPMATGVYVMTLLPALPINTVWHWLLVRFGLIGLLFALLTCILVIKLRSNHPVHSAAPYETG